MMSATARSLILGIALSGSLLAQAASNGASFALRCGKIYTSSGIDPIEDAWLVVRNGRIDSITNGPPADLPVIDASDKVVMPGIVAADTDLSGHRDADYAVTPDFQALDGFDFSREYKAALSGGVTTVYLAPGRSRLIPGQGSVVKLHGKDLVERVLAEANCLRITMGKESTNAPKLFEPTPHPTSDDPLLPARSQYPSARISQLATLRMLFEEARAAGQDLQGQGSAENQFSSLAMQAASSGQLPVRIAVREAADISRAIRFAQELGATCVLEDPYQIEKVARMAKAENVSAVFRMPVMISANNRGGENRKDQRPISRPENIGIAGDAGMKVALAPGRNAELAEYLLVAGISIRYGLDPEQAMRAITIDAASILGVDDRVGSLEAGKDADFLVLSGEPFAVGTLVEKTYVDGELAFERSTESNVLAVRVGKIITGEGRTLRDGVIVVADGKIKAIGEDLAVPHGASIIDMREAVMVPGFVDAYTSLGLSGDGVGVPTGSANQAIAEIVDPEDPLFDRALRAGLTTVLVSGRDAGPVSGRVTAIKTGASDREGMVLRETAGIRFVHDAIGPQSINTLKGSLDRGKKYIESWKKYEKALADFAAGKGKKPATASSSAEPAQVDPLSGTWEIQVTGEIPVEISITLELELDGDSVTGTAQVSFQGQQPPASDIEDGSFDGNTLRLSVSMMGNSAELVAEVADDKMTGTFGAGPMSAEISGERTSKPDPQASTDTEEDDSGEPKKPNIDQNLEPLRALLEKRIPAVINSNRAPAVKAVVDLFEKEALPYILYGVKDAIDTPSILGEEPPPVMIGPQLVRREKGKVINSAAMLADRDIALALVTGDTAGSSYLPLHAAHAIRYGMDPQAALEAMTIGPARMFQLDDRIGSLRRGKDADFVVFSGSPFEMTSRILMVVSNGRVVVDERDMENGK
ncbi:MAG: amidohydrolase family protein [Planctomycetota bacterium]